MKTSIRIRMDLEYDSFGVEQREEFLADLSFISGCPIDQIDNVHFVSGCVIFVGEIDKHAAARLVEYFNSLDDEALPTELVEFRSFCEKWLVKATFTYDPVSIDTAIAEEQQVESEKGDVVFVHGWNGDADSFARMPDFISEIVECNVHVYCYPTKSLRESPSLEYVSRNLDNWIRNRISSKKIGMVAHSMGGLIARRWVVQQHWREDRLDTLVRQMTLVASPSNGTALANIGAHVPFLAKTQIDDLNTGSSFLLALNSDWMHWAGSDYSKNCTIRSIYGTSDKVVSANSAMGLDPNAVPILGADHIGIVKPKSKDDEVVQTLGRFLLEAGFESSDDVG